MSFLHRVADYNCVCPPTFLDKPHGGKNCTTELTGCLVNDCQNEATCIPHLVSLSWLHKHQKDILYNTIFDCTSWNCFFPGGRDEGYSQLYVWLWGGVDGVLLWSSDHHVLVRLLVGSSSAHSGQEEPARSTLVQVNQQDITFWIE